MDTIYILIILVALLLLNVILTLSKKRRLPKAGTYQPDFEFKPCEIYPYEKKMLLTKTEYKFYMILKKKCDDKNLLICPKVRMEDFLSVTDRQNFYKYRGYIKSRHIDFLICNSKLYLLAGLELDDYSHQQEKAKKIDDFKDNVFHTIDLPLYRIKVTDEDYDKQIDYMLRDLRV
ncbi:MAG: DUF2726 domain-containing protein [Lachnospiraceae bacterium]|nr:DUF2726 domain-containing protein [Lachnospiraceae bacterium]